MLHFHLGAPAFIQVFTGEYCTTFRELKAHDLSRMSSLSVILAPSPREIGPNRGSTRTRVPFLHACHFSSFEGNRSRLLRAEYATFESVFPQIYLFPVQDAATPDEVINVALVALKSPLVPEFSNDDSRLNNMLSRKWTNGIEMDLPILTDDHAPVEMYASE